MLGLLLSADTQIASYWASAFSPRILLQESRAGLTGPTRKGIVTSMEAWASVISVLTCRGGCPEAGPALRLFLDFFTVVSGPCEAPEGICRSFRDDWTSCHCLSTGSRSR